MNKYIEFSKELIGQTINKVCTNSERNEMYIFLENGKQYKFYHEQDCCEAVWIEDIIGNLDDLIGSPLLMAEKVCEDGITKDDYGTATWTFYKFATINGYVTVRWCGESNGYYSEEVSLVEIKEKE